MTKSFTMTRAEVVGSDAVTLKAAIVAATGSERGADSIMRSLERMADDPSIDYFEMTEVTSARRYGGAAPAAWRVRADRGIPHESGL
jgi:hypothetical protein